MRKRNLLFRLVVIIFMLCLVMSFTSYILRKDEVYVKNQEFYEEDEKYDILFFGSSHSNMGILPMELWNDYGITSYNLSNGGQRLALDYWMLKEALEHQTPSLVVIDTYTTVSDEKYADSLITSLHESLDSMPLSMTKIQTVYDMFPEGNRAEFLVPFCIYHNRWESVTEEYFQKPVSYQKGSYENGALAIPLVAPMEKIDNMADEETVVTETLNLAYLRKSIELCQEKEVPVLLMITPYYNIENYSLCMKAARMVAEEYGLPLVNGVEEDVVNTKTDLRDVEHLNSSGARKWTAFIGNYISQNYEIADKRTDTAYSDWNLEYEKYTAWKLGNFSSAENLYSYMINLQDDAFNYGIFVKAGSEHLNNEQFWEMMKNAGLQSSLSDGTKDYYCVINHKTGEVSEFFGKEAHNELAKTQVTVAAGDDVKILVIDSQSGYALQQYPVVEE